MVPNLLMWAASAIAAGWKLSQLVRVPRDAGLRVVTACVVLVFLALSAQLIVTIPGLAEQVPSQTPKLLQNVLLTVFFALLLVLLQSSLAPDKLGSRGSVELALAVATSAGLIAAFAATPETVQGASYGEGSGHPRVLAFYLLGNVYMAYATARGAFLSWTSGGQTRSHARLSLRVAALGLVVNCVGTHLPRVIATSGQLVADTELIPGTAVWTTPVLAVGITVFFLGIGYPGVRTGLIKARLWFQVRRHYRILRPLWQAVYEQFPHIALFAPQPAWREALHVRHMRLRYYRRVIECRDGLVCLSPYVDQPGESGRSAREHAELVRQALASRARGSQVSVASVLAAPAEAGMEADIDELLALSRELSRRSEQTPAPAGQ